MDALTEKAWLRTPPRNHRATIEKRTDRNHAATTMKPSRNHPATTPATMPRNRATTLIERGLMVAPLARGSAYRHLGSRLSFALAYGFACWALLHGFIP